MAQIRVVVDGKTIVDSNPDQWGDYEPKEISAVKDLAGQNGTLQPAMMLVQFYVVQMAAISLAKRRGVARMGSDSTMKNFTTDTTITITTRDSGWTLDVEHAK